MYLRRSRVSGLEFRSFQHVCQGSGEKDAEVGQPKCPKLTPGRLEIVNLPISPRGD